MYNIMKKIIISGLISVFAMTGIAFAESTSTTNTPPVSGVGSEVSSINQQAQDQIKALRQEMEAKIKTIRDDYNARIKAIRQAAEANAKAVREKLKEQRKQLQLQRQEKQKELESERKVKLEGKFKNATTSASSTPQ